jgi:DNA-binding winged helix-turn-helix (wHTH) protein/tetratricopeptide (TPR) repeat protein
VKQFPPFRLDAINQCLWRRRTDGGEEERILLTPTEYGVLDHLVEHAGQLVTHRELLDAVWPDIAIEPQAVKSKVFHLRRVLEDDPKRPRFIETLPRRGYRFVGRLAEPAQADEEAPTSEVRFVGRERALAEMWTCLRNAGAGKSQVVFITGEPGIGKTALAQEFQRQVAAARTTWRLVRGQCVEGFGTKEPFYPVLQAVGQLCRGANRAMVIDTLASYAPTWLVQIPAILTRELRETLRQEILGATRERMLREICEALEAIAASEPLVLVLEDLHWADSSTLDLVSALARSPLSARIMLIATFRSTDVTRSVQPLHALRRDLAARHLSRELVLEPLAKTEIAAYLASGDGSTDVPVELAALLHRHTEGNPLFMIAVLEHLTASGLVERSEGSWRLRRPADEISLEVPESLRQMIEAQIDRLDELEQRVLEAGAIAGISFAPLISAPTTGIPDSQFEACCETLVRRGHILCLGRTQQLPHGRVIQRYAFVHGLYREVLYERVAPARRAMLHLRKAERLEEVFAGALDDLATEIAQHFEKGAGWARAIWHLRRAAERDARRFSVETARANLEHALALASRLPAAERARAEIEILFSQAGLQLAAMDARVVETLTTLRDKAIECGRIDLEVQALVDLAYPLAWASSERSLEVIDRALRLCEGLSDPLLHAGTRARCMVRRIMARGWNAKDSEERERALLEIGRIGTREDLAWHKIDGGFVEVTASRYRQARHDVVESIAVLREVHDENIPLGFLAAHRLREYTVPWSLTFLGEWGAALREFDTSIAQAERNADDFGSGILRLLKCWLQLFAMDFAGAASACDAMLATGPPGQMFGWHLCLALSGAAESGLGNNETARKRLLAAREEMDAHVALLDWNSRLWQRWALTNHWLSTSELARAREESELFVANAITAPERTWQALSWDAHARVALASGDLQGGQKSIDRALEAVEGFEVPVAAWQAHATAASIARARCDDAGARHHRTASRALVDALAASLEPDEALRRTFVAAPLVVRSLHEE